MHMLAGSREPSLIKRRKRDIGLGALSNLANLIARRCRRRGLLGRLLGRKPFGHRVLAAKLALVRVAAFEVGAA